MYGTYNRQVPSHQTDASTPRPPRILGLDVGSRRSGLAVSDPLGITAQGLETLQRQNKRSDFAQLEQVIRHYQVAAIVMGLPLRMTGAEATQAEKMQTFAEEIRRPLPLPVHLGAERLTAVQANRLLRETHTPITRPHTLRHQLAEGLIAQVARASGTRQD